MPDSTNFEQTQRNKIKRVPTLGSYDKETVFRIIDQAWICNVGIANLDPNTGAMAPTVIPMFHVRMNDEVVFHGATTSRLIRHIATGATVCLSATMVDGLVLARSLFHHSMNYRSVVAFGSGRPITDRNECLAAFKALSDKVVPGRWEDARQPNEKELKATALVAVKINSASAKVRTGGPVDDPEDKKLPVWAGVIPFTETLLPVQADSELEPGTEVPEYVRSLYPG